MRKEKRNELGIDTMMSIVYGVIMICGMTSAAFAADLKTLDLQVPIGGTKQIPICVEKGGGYIECSGLATYIKIVYEFAVAAGAILATMMLVWGGTIWLLSGGNTGKVGEAKKIIGNSITGLALLLGSFVLLYAINPKLIELPSLDLSKIKPIDLPKTALLVTKSLPQNPGACCYKEPFASRLPGHNGTKIGKKATNGLACFGMISQANEDRKYIDNSGFFCEGDTIGKSEDAKLCWTNFDQADDTLSTLCAGHATPINPVDATFDQGKYTSWGYPAANPNGAKLSGSALSNWKTLIPYAASAAMAIGNGIDIGAIGMWPYIEGTQFAPYNLHNCHSGGRDNASHDPNTECNDTANPARRLWQTGYGLHAQYEFKSLKKAIKAMYAIGDAQVDAKAQEIAQRVIANSSGQLNGFTYPTTAGYLDTLVSGATEADYWNKSWADRRLIDLFLRDPAVGMYLVAEHVNGYLKQPGRTGWGWGSDTGFYNKQKIIDSVYAIFEASK